ncbi:MAG TPA: hypothetical protein VHX49_13000 [Candidatus Acidoferrales bacterium]|jgi:hypothetical protein|nr:hypothetical protein [Candidatus Acidoferrales bacterium]
MGGPLDIPRGRNGVEGYPRSGGNRASLGKRMELYRIIFRVDFPPAFKLFSHWGDALELLNANKLWTQLGETNSRQILAQKNDREKGINHNTVVEISSVNGNLEEYPLGSIDRFEHVFRDVNALVGLVGASSFLRVGARFIFLEPTESFDVARRMFSEQVQREYLAVLGRELTDMSIISVSKEEDQFRRVHAGPISRKEYPGWFSVPDKVNVENALLVDIDFYTFEYKFKTFDLRKFVDMGYGVARKQATELLKIVIRGQGA